MDHLGTSPLAIKFNLCLATGLWQNRLSAAFIVISDLKRRRVNPKYPNCKRAGSLWSTGVINGVALNHRDGGPVGAVSPLIRFLRLLDKSALSST
jgi:hypothetical protein